MESEHFLKYLQETNQLNKIHHINADGTPNMKHKYVRDLYHQYLYQETPTFECSICLDEIKDNMCKLKCGHCFCVDCFSNLARTSNNCALCRKEICSNLIKKKVNEDGLIRLINYEMETAYTERDNMKCQILYTNELPSYTTMKQKASICYLVPWIQYQWVFNRYTLSECVEIME